jgi:predicted site-specific integrase-resolvase
MKHPKGPALREQEAANYIGVAPKTLANWRVSGFGPAFVKLGGAVRYLRGDLDSFIKQNRRRSTSDGPAWGGPERG